MTGAIIVLVLILIVILGIILSQKSKKKLKSALQQIDDFNADEKYTSEDSATILAVDNKRNKIAIIEEKEDYKAYCYEFKDIFESEIIVDGKSYSRTSTTRTVGRMLIGGAVLGVAGAVVGGMTAKSKQVDKIKKVQLKITVNNNEKPNHLITFIDAGFSTMDKDNPLYKSGMKEINHWHDKLKMFIEKSNRELND